MFESEAIALFIHISPAAAIASAIKAATKRIRGPRARVRQL
jgi:hypothetical protein